LQPAFKLSSGFTFDFSLDKNEEVRYTSGTNDTVTLYLSYLFQTLFPGCKPTKHAMQHGIVVQMP
jgi:hypothetical protein